MQSANQRQTDFEVLKTTNIKLNYNRNPNEFSKTMNITITAATFIMMVFLAIKFLS
jgi:hypothetical protein